MHVKVYKSFEVDSDAAIKIAWDFLEYLDSIGFNIEHTSSHLDGLSYEDLAKQWIGEIEE